jgi:hypothetical protein
LFNEGEKTVLISNEDPALMEQVLQDPEARAIAWFSPFVVVTVEEKDGQTRAQLFDPRFFRNGSSFLSTRVLISGDSS